MAQCQRNKSIRAISSGVIKWSMNVSFQMAWCVYVVCEFYFTNLSLSDLIRKQGLFVVVDRKCIKSLLLFISHDVYLVNVNKKINGDCYHIDERKTLHVICVLHFISIILNTLT